VGRCRTLNISCLYPQVLQCTIGSRALIFGFRDDITPHMAVGTERRAKKTAARLEHSLLLQPVHTAMSFNPPNHDTGFDGSHVVDTNSTPSPTDRLDSIQPTLTGQEPTTRPSHHSARKRRPSKSKVPGELRKSSSTPHMRHLALTTGELSPTSNKPRNKLGYHRTSVACGK
jgi:hypothetical protein